MLALPVSFNIEKAEGSIHHGRAIDAEVFGCGHWKVERIRKGSLEVFGGHEGRTARATTRDGQRVKRKHWLSQMTRVGVEESGCLSTREAARGFRVARAVPMGSLRF